MTAVRPVPTLRQSFLAFAERLNKAFAPIALLPFLGNVFISQVLVSFADIRTSFLEN